MSVGHVRERRPTGPDSASAGRKQNIQKGVRLKEAIITAGYRRNQAYKTLQELRAKRDEFYRKVVAACRVDTLEALT